MLYFDRSAGDADHRNPARMEEGIEVRRVHAGFHSSGAGENRYLRKPIKGD